MGEGQCADVWKASETNFKMRPCNGLDHQAFYFDTWPPPARLRTDLLPGYCLDYHTNNGNLYWSTCHDGANQKWFFRDGAVGEVAYVPADARRFGSAYDEKCMDIDSNGDNLYMHDCHDGTNQQFWFDVPSPTPPPSFPPTPPAPPSTPPPLGYGPTSAMLLKSLATSKCGDFHMGNNDLYMSNCHTGNNQQFYFETWPPPSRIKTLQDSNKCLDYHTGNGNLYFGGCHDGNNQKFFFHDGDSATIATASVGACQCIPCGDTVAGFTSGICGAETVTCSATSGKNAGCYGDTGGCDCATSTIIPSGRRMGSLHDHKCVDINMNSMSVVMWDCHDGNNQKFYLEY